MQLRSATALMDVRAKLGRTTNVENVQFFLRTMDKTAGREGDDSYIVKTVLRKNKEMLTAEEKPVWARELFRADCAAQAIRTCQDAERHYIRIRENRRLPSQGQGQ